MASPHFSRNQIRKAGRTLRLYSRGEATDEARGAALETIQRYRDGFANPMGEVQGTLHAIVYLLFGTERLQPVARLKQISTIENKVTRESSLDLWTMQDIGGCRVVVASIEDCYLVTDRILEEWPSSKVDDYIKTPRDSGYRAIHIVVSQDDTSIEIQVRCKEHHEWAETVELFSKHIGINYKFDGTHPVQLMMKIQADVRELHREGRVPHPETLVLWSTLKDEVRLFIEQLQKDQTSQTRTGTTDE